MDEFGFGLMSRYSLAITPADQRAAREHYQRARDALRTLTPAARRLLARLLDMMDKNNGLPVNRPAIARQIGRPAGLCPHDIVLLKRLQRAGLIHSKRQRLRPLPPDNLGRGSEFVYWIDDDTGYILNKLRKSSKQPERA